jgi:hypothetical protein
VSDPTLNDQALELAPLLKRAGTVIESEIRGRSMGSTLPPGSRIRIRCGTAATYPEGTVIAFVGGTGLVGHRVVGHGRQRAGGALLLTRGDGTLVCDPPIEPGRILGEVIERRDGESWRPLPAAPSATLLGRGTAAATLLLIRAALVLDLRLAARTAVILAAVARRLAPQPPLP